jgi:hypothetical protein
VIAGGPAQSPCLAAGTRAATKKKKKSSPFAKCKRIHNKKKRKRCNRKVRKKLKTA